jgi:hypothetical protein
MSVAPDPFWIITFSQPELWRSLALEDQIALVLNRFPAETVDQIAAQLPRLAAEDRRAGLPHLLRHWATSRLRGAEISTSAPDAKETRKRVIELRRAMLKAAAKFRALSDEGVMMLSRELEGPQPVTKAHQLQRDFVALADCVVAAATRAMARKPKPGPKRKDELVASICSLADIYAHVTGLEPTRAYDPVKQQVSGPFAAFARACLQAYDPRPGPLAWSIRRALELRARGEDRRS